MKNILSLVVIMSTLTVLLSGCGPAKNDIEAFLKPYEANTTMESYTLQPPDSITVVCSEIEQINGVTQTIRADGKVSFEDLGEITAAGKTPSELATEITAKLRTLYALDGDYPLDVQIDKPASKVYYVFGEVGRPGQIPFSGRVTVLNALAYSDPQITAWKSEITIVRPDGKPEFDDKGKPIFKARKMLKINLDDMVAKGDTSENVLLQENDIVWVPPTPLAAIANVLAEFVRPIGLALQPVASYSQIQRYD
ncbi:MAG: polysaccharide biosynthesis/export family protein [Sedimentisphaerales bacterium]|nr:polysaccharide biosynthesis/export family protein [Sedimentisphaerales bacterium]